MQRKKNKTQKKQRRTEIEDDEITIYYDHITGEPITDPAFPVLIKNGTEWSKNNSILIREVSDFIKKHHKYTSTIVSPPYDAATLEKSEELLKRFTGHVEKLLQLEQGMTDYNKRNNRTIPTDLPKAKASCLNTFTYLKQTVAEKYFLAGRAANITGRKRIEILSHAKNLIQELLVSDVLTKEIKGGLQEQLNAINQDFDNCLSDPNDPLKKIMDTVKTSDPSKLSSLFESAFTATDDPVTKFRILYYHANQLEKRLLNRKYQLVIVDTRNDYDCYTKANNLLIDAAKLKLTAGFDNEKTQSLVAVICTTLYVNAELLVKIAKENFKDFKWLTTLREKNNLIAQAELSFNYATKLKPYLSRDFSEYQYLQNDIKIIKEKLSKEEKTEADEIDAIVTAWNTYLTALKELTKQSNEIIAPHEAAIKAKQTPTHDDETIDKFEQLIQKSNDIDKNFTELEKWINTHAKNEFINENDNIKYFKNGGIKSLQTILAKNLIKLKQLTADKLIIAHRENDTDEPTKTQKNHIAKAYNLLLDVRSLYETYPPSTTKIKAVLEVCIAYVKDYFDKYKMDQGSNKKPEKKSKHSRAISPHDVETDDSDDENIYEFNLGSSSATTYTVNLTEQLNQLEIAYSAINLFTQIKTLTHLAEDLKIVAESFKANRFTLAKEIKTICETIQKFYSDFFAANKIENDFIDYIIQPNISFSVTDLFKIAKLCIKLSTTLYAKLPTVTIDDTSNLGNGITIVSQHVQMLLDKTIQHEDYRRQQSEQRRDRIKAITISRFGRQYWYWNEEENEGKEKGDKLELSPPALELQRIQKRLHDLKVVKQDLDKITVEFTHANTKSTSVIDLNVVANNQESVRENPPKPKHQLYRSTSLQTFFNPVRLQKQKEKVARFGRPEKGSIKI